MKVNSKTTRVFVARAVRSTARTLYNSARSGSAKPQARATGKITTLALRRIDGWSAFRFGLIFGPLFYTLVGLAMSFNGIGVGHFEYIGGVLKSIVFGGVGGFIFAAIYNAIAQRYGPLKFDLEVMTHEPQDRSRPR